MAGPIRILPTPGVTFDRTVNGLKLGQFPTNKGRQVELTLLVDTSEMTEPFATTSVDTSPGFVKAELVPAGQLSVQARGQRSSRDPSNGTHSISPRPGRNSDESSIWTGYQDQVVVQGVLTQRLPGNRGNEYLCADGLEL